MKLYNLSPRFFGKRDGKETRLTWNDGSETVHYDVPEKINCSSCDGEVIRDEDIVRYEGLCQRCFPQVRWGIPFEVQVSEPRPGYSTGEKVYWERQVEQTFTSGAENSFSRGGADYFGNNFGLHDLVVYDPKNQMPEDYGKTNSNLSVGKIASQSPVFPSSPKPEQTPPLSAEYKTEGFGDLRFKGRINGVVLDIHQYNPGFSGDRKRFLVRGYFGRAGKMDIFSSQLEALTCSGLRLNEKEIARFQEALKDVSVYYDPFQNGEGEAFSDSIARALLISYKQNHLTETRDPPRLNRLFCDIANKLREQEIPRERVHLWLKKQLRTTRFTMGDEQIAALIPFLIGERVANYHIEQVVGANPV